jgi:deazaflavin-dependent oxidoreductase (nitroreductase family)
MPVSASTVAPVWRRQGRVRDWFHTRAGAKFLNLQTIWFRLVAPKGYAVLTTMGRRTGRLRRSNVRAVFVDGYAVVVSIVGASNDWRHNLRANPEVTLRIGRRNWNGRARAVRNDVELQRARATYCEPLHWFDFVSSLVNQRGIPWPRRVRELHARWVDEGDLFVIEFIGRA